MTVKRRSFLHLMFITIVGIVVLPPRVSAQQNNLPQYEILLKSRHFTPSAGIEPEIQRFMQASGIGRQHVILQFSDIPGKLHREQLANEGIYLLGYVPYYAYYASIPSSFDPHSPALSSLRWMGAIKPDPWPLLSMSSLILSPTEILATEDTLMLVSPDFASAVK